MLGNAPPSNRAARAIWRRSERSASPAPGYCTLTATSRPSCQTARCTWPMDAAADGSSSNEVNRCLHPGPSSRASMACTAARSIGGAESCSRVSVSRYGPASSSGSAASKTDNACPNFMAPPLRSPSTRKSCSAVRACTSVSTDSAGWPTSRRPMPTVVRPAKPSGSVASRAVLATARLGSCRRGRSASVSLTAPLSPIAQLSRAHPQPGCNAQVCAHLFDQVVVEAEAGAVGDRVPTGQVGEHLAYGPGRQGRLEHRAARRRHAVRGGRGSRELGDQGGPGRVDSRPRGVDAAQAPGAAGQDEGAKHRGAVDDGDCQVRRAGGDEIVAVAAAGELAHQDRHVGRSGGVALAAVVRAEYAGPCQQPSDRLGERAPAAYVHRRRLSFTAAGGGRGGPLAPRQPVGSLLGHGCGPDRGRIGDDTGCCQHVERAAGARRVGQSTRRHGVDHRFDVAQAVESADHPAQPLGVVQHDRAARLQTDLQVAGIAAQQAGTGTQDGTHPSSLPCGRPVGCRSSTGPARDKTPAPAGVLSLAVAALAAAVLWVRPCRGCG